MVFSENEKNIIQSNWLFAGLKDEELTRALDFFETRALDIKKGAFLVRAGEPMRVFALVLTGEMLVCSDDMYARRVIYADVPKGGMFGEALCYLGTDCLPIYAVAGADSKLLVMKTDALRRNETDAFSLMMRERFTALIAATLLRMNDRVQALAKPSIREKLLTFLTQQAKRQGGNAFTISMNREALADYLGVNRAALSREMARMRAEGIIEYRKNRFTLRA